LSLNALGKGQPLPISSKKKKLRQHATQLALFPETHFGSFASVGSVLQIQKNRKLKNVHHKEFFAITTV
jgi:hypothetical protein